MSRSLDSTIKMQWILLYSLFCYNFFYLARFFVIGVNDDMDDERCSAGSALFKHTDLFQ